MLFFLCVFFLQCLLFCCFSVGLQKYKPLRRLRTLIAYRSSSPAGSHVSSSRAHGLSPDLRSVLSPSARLSFCLRPP